MKKGLRYIGWLLLGTAFVAAAQTLPKEASDVARAREWVRSVAGAFDAMPGYEVRFEVRTVRDTLAGRYEVQGKRYYMQLAAAEVYGDDVVRYEINPEYREVVIDAAKPASHNLLDNPTRAFDLLDEGYDPLLLDESAERVVVRLTPVEPDPAAVTIEVAIDAHRALPERVTYAIDGDRIEIKIREVRSRTEAPRTFDRTAYEGYELIDFR